MHFIEYRFIQIKVSEMSYIIREANENDFQKIHALNKAFSQFIKKPDKNLRSLLSR